MQKALNERLSEQEKNAELVLLQSQQTFMNERDQEVEKCSQMHTQELNHRIKQHESAMNELQQ